MSHNQINTIPDWIGEITSLEVLRLYECNLTTIPSW